MSGSAGKKTVEVTDLIEADPLDVNVIVSDNFCSQADQLYGRVKASQGYEPILLHHEAFSTKEPTALYYDVVIRKRSTIILLNNNTRCV